MRCAIAECLNRRRHGRAWGWRLHAGVVVGFALFVAGTATSARAAEEVLPKHITPETLKAVRAGLDYLARTQGTDGAWGGDQGARHTPWR